jgi:hypothetical protein
MAGGFNNNIDLDSIERFKVRDEYGSAHTCNGCGCMAGICAFPLVW